MSQIKAKKSLAVLIFVSLFVFLFQNCSSDSGYQFGFGKQNEYGGAGADGLTFVNYAACSSGGQGEANILVLTPDLASAALTRQNCTDLPAPVPVAMSEIQFSVSDPAVLQYAGAVFDQQVAIGVQRVTLQFCQDSTVQNLIWQNIGNSSLLFGNLTLASGGTSAVLNVLTPPLGSLNYATAVGQSSSFDLDLNINPASLQYSFAGGSLVSAKNVVCASQSPPQIPDDGSAGAPPGPPQAPSILSAYALRAPWKVAGVDYAVGIPEGLTLKNPLTDPTILNNPNISIDKVNQIINLNGGNITLNGYDFGTYSIAINSGSHTTISNSKVTMIDSLAASSNLTVTNCLLDGGGSSGTKWALISNTGTGLLTLEYNWMRNFPSKAVQESPANGSVVMKYNLMEYGGMNGVEEYFGPFSGGVFSSVVVEFNTIYQPYEGGPANEAFSYEAPNMSATGDIAYNSIIALPSTGNKTMSYLIDAFPGSGGVINLQIHDNYMDPTGAYGALFPGAVGSPSQVTYSNNFNMVNAAAFSNHP